MLSPSEYDRLCDQIITLYDDLDNAIISDITRRIVKSGRVTETARWQAKQLQESGLLYDDMISEIANRTDATNQHVRTLFEDSGVQSIRNDNRRYRAAGLEGIVKMSDSALQTLYAGYVKCGGDLQNLTLTTASTSQTAYINACNQAYMQVTSGAFSYQAAIKQAVQRAAQNGTYVQYPTGHRDRLDVAVRRSVLTGVGQTVRQISLVNANDMGCDLMEITAHSGARPSHAQWQGQLVSLSGRRGYLSLKDIGYGTGDGFGGWNCRHDWFPFFEGISEPAYTSRQLAEFDEKYIEYNGVKYSEYEISQIQRKIEREIRSAKREQVAFKVAVAEATDSELQQVMQDSLNYANSLVKVKQAKMRDFIEQTGQDRDYFREQNYSKVDYGKQTNMDYMARFNPKFSDRKNLNLDKLSIPVKTVSNSKFIMFTDIDADRKNKAVRLIEKNLIKIQKDLPKGFEMPSVAVIDFDKHNINPKGQEAIGGYKKETGFMYINMKFDTTEKILGFVNRSKGYFANKTEYAPFLHELGHKYYEDSIKRLAISQNMSYNDMKSKIDRKIYEYIESKGGEFFIETNLSEYAKRGYKKNLFTEVIAECFSVKNDNSIAREILNLLE